MARKKDASQRTDVFISVALVSAFIIGVRIAPTTNPVISLPQPGKIADLAYSGPLMLTQINESVLGAETIDPVEFVHVINSERKKVGSPDLRLSTTLMQAAKMRVTVMKKYQHFSHQDPNEGIELATVLPKLNYHFSLATENIGMGGLSASNFVTGFMNSTSHRQNLLDPRLTDTGAAFDDGPYKQYYVNYAVQLFAIPAGTDEYLGYSDKEVSLYKSALSAVKSNLHPLVRFVRIVRNQRATPGYYEKLARQKTILETILPGMQKHVPFTNREVTLVLEYNSLL